MHTPLREKLISAAGAAGVVALLGYALIEGLTVQMRMALEQPMALLDLRPPPPPPRPEPPVEHVVAKVAKGKASPRNLRNKATAVVAPPPVVLPPPPPPTIVTAPKPGPGAAPSNGASDRPGPGEGAGGQGNGTGGGGDGDGDGDGVPPRQIRGKLKFSDLPPDLRQSWTGGSVGVRYRVEVDGRVSDCSVTRSSGSAELDRVTCQLIEQRFRFKPSRDEDGEVVRSYIVETHSWMIDRTEDAPRP